ncbi:hypothetical protein OUZ56_012083 [Daphnia magna]|uniref:Uncharacterized protein n=1 Tax=Daphnia magna TaxID=35525 RepID=A0ABQ9Z202_9CRUS|nr:hypothetical protein OUZ56_012083 [Daphnia magna]
MSAIFSVNCYVSWLKKKEARPTPSGGHSYTAIRNAKLPSILQLGLHETVSKGRDRHRYIPVGLFRPSDWLSPSPHPKAPPPLLLVIYCELSPIGNWVGAGRRTTVSKPDFGRIRKTISPKVNHI